MAERYTETSKRIIFFARYEARQHGSGKISPEHVLLGLLRESREVFESLVPYCDDLSPESLRNAVEERLVREERIPKNSELILSDEVKALFTVAIEESDRFGNGTIGPKDILMALTSSRDNLASEILLENGITRELLAEVFGRRTQDQEKEEGGGLTRYLTDITARASEGRLDPLIGRADEVERVIEVICRRSKNNVILIGDAGVGKTAIVEGLAQKIARGDVPAFLSGKKILALDLSALVAGTKYRGQFEERLKGIVDGLKNDPEVIVFIDEIHTIVGAGSAEGTLDAANILKPALARREFQCIGATTPSEFRKTIEKDRALERRFQPIRIDAPSEDEAIRIVAGLAPRYEKFHSVKYSDEALISSVTLTSRFLPDRFLPDKAIDAIDEAGARARLGKSTDRIGRPEIENVIARWTGIPIEALRDDESERLLAMEKILGTKIIAQKEAVSLLTRAIRRSRAGISDRNRPVGSFLFLGPTGVGKTETAKALAEFLFGSNGALIRFDMSEFAEKHSVAKLIGSPPGYVGYDEGGRLTEALRKRPYSVVLLDEIEKSHPDVWNVLLQIFDEGQITDANGISADCRNSIFIMTSNIGAIESNKTSHLGFQSNNSDDKDLRKERVFAELRRTMSPELLSRIDETVVFDQLSEGDLLQILDNQLEVLERRLGDRGLGLKLTAKAKSHILNASCGDRSKGAREIKNVLRRLVEDGISETILLSKPSVGATISVDLKSDRLTFKLS
jgi:ATP-dependent Clp protease ATP-binding subunit ClpC